MRRGLGAGRNIRETIGGKRELQSSAQKGKLNEVFLRRGEGRRERRKGEESGNFTMLLSVRHLEKKEKEETVALLR